MPTTQTLILSVTNLLSYLGTLAPLAWAAMRDAQPAAVPSA